MSATMTTMASTHIEQLPHIAPTKHPKEESYAPSPGAVVNVLLRVDVVIINVLVMLKLAMHFCSSLAASSWVPWGAQPSEDHAQTECSDRHGHCHIVVPALLIVFLLACMPVVKAIARAQLPLRAAELPPQAPPQKRKVVRWAL